MFERFTDRARTTIVLAQEEARMMKHNMIGTEHLLIALSLEKVGGNTPEALASIGLDTETIRRRVLEILSMGERELTGHVPFTPRHKKVLEGALREALNQGLNYISPDQLLCSLVNRHVGDGTAGQILLEYTPTGAPQPLFYDVGRQTWYPWLDRPRPDTKPDTGEVDATRPEPKHVKLSVPEFKALLVKEILEADQDALMIAAVGLGVPLDQVIAVDWSGKQASAR